MLALNVTKAQRLLILALYIFRSALISGATFQSNDGHNRMTNDEK
jgi:hypothetical protein